MTAAFAYVFPPYRLVPSQRSLVSGDTPVKLGGRAFDMLVALVERRERTVSKHELMDLVWPELVVEENNLQVQVLALRKHFGHAAIATVPGRGYQFTLPVELEGTARDPATPVSCDEVSRATPTPTNLPRWRPPLFGRERDLEALTDLMDRFVWVTVVGPAGIGKTRLAQAAASARMGGSPGGVWWVDLASLEDPSLVPNAVALAMGLRTDTVADLAGTIASSIPAQATLIVLDNVEHLLEGVARFLARLRPSASQLRLLLTSQEIVHAADEQVFRVEPLTLPVDDSLAAGQASGAVSLFVARAQGGDRRFALDAGNCATVADICRRLDGIPLAIELAAARVVLLGVEGLRARLDQRFKVLTSGDRTALRRHRTLREALEWSYHLLSDAEKAVFRRLGVFAGGFSLEAAQSVAEDDRCIDGWDVLEHLGALADKSLAVVEGDPTPRYRLLETMRLYALERLMEHDEVDAVRTAHRDHFMRVAEAARIQMRSASPAGLPLLDVERDNLFLALAWTRGDDDGTRGLRLAESMRLYWTSRGLVARGLESLRAALAHPGIRGASLPRLSAEVAAAHFCCLMNRLDEGLNHASIAVALARDLGDGATKSIALGALGDVHFRRGDLVDAERCGMEAVVLAKGAGDIGKLARALSLMSAVHCRSGRLDLARDAEEEVLTLSQSCNDLRNQTVSRVNLAWIGLELGEIGTARRHLNEVLRLLPRLDSEYHGVHLVHMTALWAAATVRNELAVKLHAAYEQQCLRMDLKTPMEPSDTARLHQARDALSPSALRSAENTGRALQYFEALDLAAGALAASK